MLMIATGSIHTTMGGRHTTIGGRQRSSLGALLQTMMHCGLPWYVIRYGSMDRQFLSAGTKVPKIR
jgi:hypothetical protein